MPVTLLPSASPGLTLEARRTSRCLMPQKDLVAALLAALEKDPDINLHESPIHVTYHDSLRLEGEVANIVVKRKARRIAVQLSGLNDIEDKLLLRPGQKRIGKALLDAVTS